MTIESQQPKYDPSLMFGALMTSESMGEVKAPDWLIDTVLEKDKISCVFGPSGSFKSFVILDAALSIANGVDFNGLETEQGSVLYVCGEGLSGINKRVKAWEIEKNNGQTSQNFYATQTPILLNTPDGQEMLDAYLEGIKEHTGSYPAQIIFDTLDRNFSGDENSSSQMSEFVTALTNIRVKTKASVVVVHHTSKSNPDEARGANVLRSGMDTEIRIKKDDNGKIYFENTKMKDEADGSAIIFSHKVVNVGFDQKKGRNITSVVIEKDKKAESAVSIVEKIDNEEKSMKTGLGKHQKDTLTSLVSSIDATGEIGYEEFLLIMKQQGKTGKQVKEALQGLHNKGHVTLNSYKSPTVIALKSNGNTI